MPGDMVVLSYVPLGARIGVKDGWRPHVERCSLGKRQGGCESKKADEMRGPDHDLGS